MSERRGGLFSVDKMDLKVCCSLKKSLEGYKTTQGVGMRGQIIAASHASFYIRLYVCMQSSRLHQVIQYVLSLIIG